MVITLPEKPRSKESSFFTTPLGTSKNEKHEHGGRLKIELIKTSLPPNDNNLLLQQIQSFLKSFFNMFTIFIHEFSMKHWYS
jgi:hypothetical protein